MAAPIDPQEYLFGQSVIQIEDLRVARGLTRRPASSCKHKQLVYDDKERRIWCKDCEAEVEPFDAFIGLCSVFSAGLSSLNRRRQAVEEAEAFQVRSRAAKVMDEVWRSKTMAPLCPHCHAAILPEDVAGGVTRTGKRFIVASRRKQQERTHED